MLYLILLFIFGTVIGSFLNLCIHRLPRGESIIKPRSHCPGCNRILQPWELIPIFSYLLAQGRCRYCDQPISLRYPLVELVTGLLFVVVAFRFSAFSQMVEYIFTVIFTCLLVLVFFIDLEKQVVVDNIVLGGISFGLVLNYIRGLSWPDGSGINPFISAVLGMIIGYVILYLIRAISSFILKKEAMGEGDLFIAALLGAYLGWQGMFLSLFLAFFVGGLAGVILLVFKKAKLGAYLPFGPSLVVGGLLALFFQAQIIAWYINLFSL
ncbi:MAG: prepilin peptidase [Candidatus Margulisbacteria bacterium]|nr:prepilin peptidase [Candidatus Margulisiibacteriota bacterium]